MKKAASILLTLLLSPVLALTFIALELLIATVLMIFFPIIVIGGAAKFGLWVADKLLSLLYESGADSNIYLNFALQTLLILAAIPLVAVGAPVIGMTSFLLLTPLLIFLISPLYANKWATTIVDWLTVTDSPTHTNNGYNLMPNFEQPPDSEYGRKSSFFSMTRPRGFSAPTPPTPRSIDLTSTPRSIASTRRSSVSSLDFGAHPFFFSGVEKNGTPSDQSLEIEENGTPLDQSLENKRPSSNRSDNF